MRPTPTTGPSTGSPSTWATTWNIMTSPASRLQPAPGRWGQGNGRHRGCGGARRGRCREGLGLHCGLFLLSCRSRDGHILPCGLQGRRKGHKAHWSAWLENKKVNSRWAGARGACYSSGLLGLLQPCLSTAVTVTGWLCVWGPTHWPSLCLRGCLQQALVSRKEPRSF